MLTKQELKPTLRWTKPFYGDPRFAQFRFKYPEKIQVKFDFPDQLIDLVSYEDYYKTEKDRIPLFIGSQFGIIPRFEKAKPLFGDQKHIAILGKSLLTGAVSSLKIYSLDAQVHPDHSASPLSEMLLIQTFHN